MAFIKPTPAFIVDGVRESARLGGNLTGMGTSPGYLNCEINSERSQHKNQDNDK